MKRNLLIFLLLFTFNANAMTSTTMISKLMPAIDISAVEKQSSHHHLGSSLNEVAAHAELGKAMSSGCDSEIDCHACLAHCTFSAILVDITDLSFLERPSFSAFYSPSETDSKVFRLLRPPKLT